MKKRIYLISALLIVLFTFLLITLAVIHIELSPSGGYDSFQNAPLTMIKVDPNGDALGKWPITANGKVHRHTDDRLSVEIEITPFDSITSITLPPKGVLQIQGQLQTHWNRYHYLPVTVQPSGEQYWLAFEDNLDRWALFKAPGEPFYVGYLSSFQPSMPERYPITELIDFFDLSNWLTN